MEELEAVDCTTNRQGHDQSRAAGPSSSTIATGEGARRQVLEWLRRGDAKLAGHLRTYSSRGPFTEIEAVVEHGGQEPAHIRRQEQRRELGHRQPATRDERRVKT